MPIAHNWTSPRSIELTERFENTKGFPVRLDHSETIIVNGVEIMVGRAVVLKILTPGAEVVQSNGKTTMVRSPITIITDR